MSGLSPDPKMMRRQQDKDAPETIEADETKAGVKRSDSDAASTADREAAKRHAIADPAKGQDDVLAANQREKSSDHQEGARQNEKGLLAQDDRSKL